MFETASSIAANGLIRKSATLRSSIACAYQTRSRSVQEHLARDVVECDRRV